MAAVELKLSAPPVGEQLAVAVVAWPEGQHFEALRPGLEGFDDRRSDAQGVQRLDVDNLVVEPDPSRAREHDVDLLGPLVTVAERHTRVRSDPLQRDAGVLGAEVRGCEADLCTSP